MNNTFNNYGGYADDSKLSSSKQRVDMSGGTGLGTQNNTIDLNRKFLIGKINKLSNKGWSYHLRLLKMD